MGDLNFTVCLGFWVLCGLVAMYIYRNKNRSGLTGFLGGFLLGPVGIILALVSSDNKPKCPYCAERIQPEARVCPHCRKEVSPMN